MSMWEIILFCLSMIWLFVLFYTVVNEFEKLKITNESSMDEIYTKDTVMETPEIKGE